MIHQMNGIIVRVKRDKMIKDITNVDCHTSEVSIDNIKVDLEIQNNGTIEELYDQINIIYMFSKNNQNNNNKDEKNNFI